MEALAITLAAFLAIAIAGLALSVRITLRDRERNADQQARDAQTIKDLTARAVVAHNVDQRVVELYAQGNLGPYELAQTSYIDLGEQLVDKLNWELFDTLKKSGLIETLISDEHVGGKTVTQRIAVLRPERNKTP